MYKNHHLSLLYCHVILCCYYFLAFFHNVQVNSVCEKTFFRCYALSLPNNLFSTCANIAKNALRLMKYAIEGEVCFKQVKKQSDSFQTTEVHSTSSYC